MKKILNVLSLYLLFVIALSANIFAQNSAQKLTAEETKESVEIAAFVDSFVREYYKTYDLTKVPETFFVNDYKKRNDCPCSDEEIDKLLTDEEKFQIQFMKMDLLLLEIISDLSEVNFEPEKASNKTKADLPDFLLKRSLPFFLKYPKSMVFLEGGCEPKNVNEFRSAMTDYKKAIQEIRNSMLNKSFVDRFSSFASKNKNEMFQLERSEVCQEDECLGFPRGTKLHYYFAMPFTLLIVKDKDQFKITNVLFITK